MKSLLTTFFVLGTALFAQGEGAPVNQTAGPPPSAWTTLNFYDGSNNLVYICTASARQSITTWARSSQTALAMTSIAVSSNTATATIPSGHGLAIGNYITVSGATVDTDLNGTYKLTSVTTTTLVFTTASVANATYTESTLRFSTNAPRSSQGIWDIQYFQYDGSNNLVAIQRALGKTGLTSICDNRTTIVYQ